MERFSVVIKDKDTIQCLGVRESYETALLEAYQYMNNYAEDSGLSATVYPLCKLEDGTGSGFTFKVGDVEKNVLIVLADTLDEVCVDVKYLSDKIEKLCFVGGSKSDWVDLRCAEDIILKAGEFKLIPLGVAMKLPKGFEAIIAPRSSTFKNYGIIQTNSFGVIDESYCGDTDQWMMPVYATRDTKIALNDRICQFRLVRHQPGVLFRETVKLNDTNRGGFGSTGIK